MPTCQNTVSKPPVPRVLVMFLLDQTVTGITLMTVAPWHRLPLFYDMLGLVESRGSHGVSDAEVLAGWGV